MAIKKSRIVLAILVLSGLLVVAVQTIYAAQATEVTESKATKLPDYSTWKQEVFTVNNDENGEIDLVFKVFTKIRTINDTMESVVVSLDQNGRERLLTFVTKLGTSSTPGIKADMFVRVENKWWIHCNESTQEMCDEKLKTYIDDIGGPEKFLQAQEKLLKKSLENAKKKIEEILKEQ